MENKSERERDVSIAGLSLELLTHLGQTVMSIMSVNCKPEVMPQISQKLLWINTSITVIKMWVFILVVGGFAFLISVPGK